MISNIIFLTSSLGLLAGWVSAQNDLAEFDFFSDSSCGSDPNNLDVLSKTREFAEKAPGAASSSCSQAVGDLGAWPRNKDGLFEMWVDSSQLEGDCRLQFFVPHDSTQEEFDPDELCQQMYREVSSSSSDCAAVKISENTGVQYCCGDDCFLPEYRPSPFIPNDPAKVKRGPLLRRQSSPGDCKYVKDEDAYTTYGPQVRLEGASTCKPEQTTCGGQYQYTVGTEVTDGVNVQVEAGVELFEVFSASISTGYEHSDTSLTSFSVIHNVAPEGGTQAYPTFTPLLVCGKGHLEGNDCARLKGFPNLSLLRDHAFCVPQINSLKQPDGFFDSVRVD